MRIYTADIMAYLLALQLLFLHIVSRRVYNKVVLPEVQNPLSPDEYGDFIDKLYNSIITSGKDVLSDYHKILGSILHMLEILRALKTLEPNSYIRISQVLAKYVYTFYPLRPEHVKEELFGRIYQFGYRQKLGKTWAPSSQSPRQLRYWLV
ncbi:hypothetical protein [Vulcanisaeta sp. JCM 16159]|uniref:hypothetical protein n=1 Tax=Vulcanisaeta sp. JCM 16159 TaxID=1295371 RepID=UPI0006D2733E|nr:hypothetical protein [Vulcanisaeta sp. JCM 16159]